MLVDCSRYLARASHHETNQPTRSLACVYTRHAGRPLLSRYAYGREGLWACYDARVIMSCVLPFVAGSPMRYARHKRTQ
jgi:hypothetical protein